MDISITLEPDCAKAITRLGYSNQAIQAFVNGAIRKALQDAAELPKPQPFALGTFDPGQPLFNSAEELKALIEQIQEEEDLDKMRRSGS